jgi:tRNA (cytidine/uridine-2'-O-)-methyltransferase
LRYQRPAMKSSDTSVETILKGHQPVQKQSPLFHVVLIEPEIPQNTGNIGRTCVGTRSDLHLVGDLGFRITDKNLKRAGLDYWQHLTWTHHQQLSDWQAQVPDSKRVFYLTTKATKSYFEVEYHPGDWFVFGKETKGLDEDLLRRNADQMIQIPMLGPIRSLNVATAVTVVLYEAIRQVKNQGYLDSDRLEVR